MESSRCILCRQKASMGLSILDCMICFSCEQKLLHRQVFPYRRRRLARLYLEK